MEKLSRKEQLLKELQDLEDLNTETTEEDNGVVYKDPLEHIEEPLQADKKATKEKKPRTAKQIEAFEKARQTRERNALARKQSRDEEAIAIRKQVEDKLVKKAIAVKKKQIKQQAILDEISDDETPLEEVEKIATRSVAKTRLKREVAKDFPAAPPPAEEPVRPKYYFL
tara:strand:+ start:472 stop:978 length:507 start_codon:yes stop_codon:yes gene_type:complete